MITLGIETSCDETAVCLLETNAVGDRISYKVLGNIIHSQIDLHKEYGGVFPMLAKREHGKRLVPIIEKAIKESGIAVEPYEPSDVGAIKKSLEKEFDLSEILFSSSLIAEKPKIDRIAVTQGPGLEPALWVGVNCAQALGKLWNVPVVPINHMEGHVMSTLVGTEPELKAVTYPALAVLISGGHTELVFMKEAGSYECIGRTKDDAVGEAFDKVARMLNLPYPGGPEISKLAETAREKNMPNTIKLPRPMLHSKDLHFSFSGLKTSVLYALKEIPNITPEQVQDMAREFEDSVTEVLIAKTQAAIEEYGPQTLMIGGGVIANTHIRLAFEKLAQKNNIPLYLPGQGLSGDNAFMIAIVGAIKPLSDYRGFKAEGNLQLESGRN